MNIFDFFLKTGFPRSKIENIARMLNAVPCPSEGSQLMFLVFVFNYQKWSQVLRIVYKTSLSFCRFMSSHHSVIKCLKGLQVSRIALWRCSLSLSFCWTVYVSPSLGSQVKYWSVFPQCQGDIQPVSQLVTRSSVELFSDTALYECLEQLREAVHSKKNY